MAWGNAEREHFFAYNDGAVEEREAAADEWFLTHYCSARMRAQLEGSGISVSTARRIIARIAEIVPTGDHTSPGWNGAHLPFLVIGRGHLQLRQKWRPRFPGNVPDRRWTLVIRKPRFGLCIVEKQLYVWAETADIRAQGLAENCWVEWRSPNQRRYTTPVDLPNQGDGIHPLSDQQPLVNFLQSITKRFAAPDEKLLKVTGQNRIDLDEPEGFSVIYPRLFDEGGSDDCRENLFDNKENIQESIVQSQGKKRSVKQRPKETALPTAGISNANSMLQVLRDLAMARVQQVIPDFDQAKLNEWIMSTGYAGAKAPHQNTADLFYVYAASLCNAGGVKPKSEAFGEMIGRVVSQHLDANKLQTAPDLRELADQCRRLSKDLLFGGQFARDITEIADGHPSPRRLMVGLLNSVLAFWVWLQERHQGCAKTMYEVFRAPTCVTPSQQVFDCLRDLDRLPWMGIATAANFIKDSQVPGLKAQNLSPSASAKHLAGWFVKPDLHVVRLMAYITGRYTSHDLRQLKQSQAMMTFLSDPCTNSQGNEKNSLKADSLELQVIADVHEWACAAGTSPLEIDRLLFLVGVREIQVEKESVSTPWYPYFMSEVDAALTRGVPRKS